MMAKGGPFRTVRDLLRHGVSSLHRAGAHFGHGSTTAYDEAAYLVLHTLHLPLDTLEPFLDARLTDAEVGAVTAVIDRRARQRIPAAYLTREAWLGEHRFYVDERVIVPRSFIAELLAARMAPWITAPDEVMRVLDMCTGSGCLAILAALAFPHARVDAVDVSADALLVARRNVDDYRLSDRVRLVESDMFEKLPGGSYDLIISNPPYVDAPSMTALPAEYRAEPQLALAGGDDGLRFVHTLLRESPTRLSCAGKLVVELGHNRAAAEAAYPDLPFTWLEVAAGHDFVFTLDRGQFA